MYFDQLIVPASLAICSYTCQARSRRNMKLAYNEKRLDRMLKKKKKYMFSKIRYNGKYTSIMIQFYDEIQQGQMDES